MLARSLYGINFLSEPLSINLRTNNRTNAGLSLLSVYLINQIVSILLGHVIKAIFISYIIIYQNERYNFNISSVINTIQ